MKEGLTDDQVAKIAKHLKLAEDGPSFQAVSRYLLCYPCILTGQDQGHALRALGYGLWATSCVGGVRLSRLLRNTLMECRSLPHRASAQGILNLP